MQNRLERKRAFRGLRSRYKRSLRNGAHLPKSILKKYHLYRVRTRLVVAGRNRPSLRKQVSITVPPVFSFFREPKRCTDFLERVKLALSDRDTAFDLFIDHRKTTEISIDASFLFDEIINSYVSYWKSRKIKINIAGKVSLDRDVNNFLLSFGLFSNINVVAKQICPIFADTNHGEQYIIRKIRGRSDLQHSAGNACTELTNFFDQCFKANGFTIKEEAKGNLVDTFGEIIKNAEEHSGNQENHWVAIGCYSRKHHLCSFSIINYGRSFYDSLADESSTAATVLAEVDDIVLKHVGFLGRAFIADKEKYAQNIWTMMALQDGISSKRTSEGRASSRGQGIMDVVTFIEAMRNKAHEANKIAIVSGFTSIAIDFKYPVVNRLLKNGAEKRRMMIFNPTQDLLMPPDKEYIDSVESKFHGTIFSGAFVIDPVYLTEKIKEAVNGK